MCIDAEIYIKFLTKLMFNKFVIFSEEAVQGLGHNEEPQFDSLVA